MAAVEADPTPASSPAKAAGSSLSGPPTGLTPPAPGRTKLVGVVVEHLPAGGYHYLKVEQEPGDVHWVVTMRGNVTTGARVVVDNLGTRRDFHSRRLDRRFDELIFGVVDVAS